jgi:hypothetical protein
MTKEYEEFLLTQSTSQLETHQQVLKARVEKAYVEMDTRLFTLQKLNQVNDDIAIIGLIGNILIDRIWEIPSP